MSTTSSTSPTLPLERRDIRSAARPFKRDKDQGSKWSNGMRPGAGVILNYNASSFAEELHAGSESQKEKVRPRKQISQTYSDTKSHANKTPKPHGGSAWDQGRQSSRIAHKVDAHFESQSHHTTSPLSRSLLELLPKHANNEPAISLTPSHSEILYSFDNKGASPGEKGRKVDLGGLVEKAEKKWVAEQTEKIVRGEYEVLDLQGESTVLKKGKRSPRQKAAKGSSSVEVVDDDGFELV